MIDPDPRTIRKDDRLLDQLGRGGHADGDEAELMLAAWRRSMPVAGPPDERLLAAVTAPVARPKRRLARTSLGVAASVALACGGVTVAAAYARPDSPLWPVTRFVYGNLADSRVALDSADHAVSDARAAAADGRFGEAARLLATADRLADKVAEPQAAQRLRGDIAHVRALLPDDSKTTTGTSHVPGPTESLGVDAPPVEPANPTPGARDLPTDTPGDGERDDDRERGPDDGDGEGGADDGDGDGEGTEGEEDSEKPTSPKGKGKKYQHHVQLPPLPELPDR